MKIRKRYEEKVIKLVDVGAPNLWGVFKNGVSKACDEVCGKKRGRKNTGNTWWWNEEEKDAVSRKKEAHKAMCQNSTEENKKNHKNIAKITISKTIRLKRRLLS